MTKTGVKNKEKYFSDIVREVKYNNKFHHHFLHKLHVGIKSYTNVKKKTTPKPKWIH